MISRSEMIKRSTLISIFKEIKRKPLRVYIKKDFRGTLGSKRAGVYLELLSNLGILERVRNIKDCGHCQNVRMELKGYRLIQERKLPTAQEIINDS